MVERFRDDGQIQGRIMRSVTTVRRFVAAGITVILCTTGGDTAVAQITTAPKAATAVQKTTPAATSAAQRSAIPTPKIADQTLTAPNTAKAGAAAQKATPTEVSAAQKTETPDPAVGTAQSGTSAAPVAPTTGTIPVGTVTDPDKDPIHAIVNGEPIRLSELKQECLACYGQKVLEVLTNKLLIATECEKNGISVSPTEVQAEIDRVAKSHGITTELYLSQILETRGISRLQYEADIVWPELAMAKLAVGQIVSTDEELMREYEIRYGEAVKALMIQMADKARAEEVRAQALADPDSFGDLAKKYSEDAASASLRGVIPLIRRHLVEPAIETAIFSMPDDGISEIFQIGSDYVFLQRIALMPAEVIFEQAKESLRQDLRIQKLRGVRDTLLRKMQETAKVENILNDPERSRQMPGVAAIINGASVRTDDLALRCVERHGSIVLQSMIDKKLVEQMLKKKGIEVTADDIEKQLAEIGRAHV